MVCFPLARLTQSNCTFDAGYLFDDLCNAIYKRMKNFSFLRFIHNLVVFLKLKITKNWLILNTIWFRTICSVRVLKQPIVVGYGKTEFCWESYLKVTQSVAAPPELFQEGCQIIWEIINDFNKIFYFFTTPTTLKYRKRSTSLGCYSLAAVIVWINLSNYKIPNWSKHLTTFLALQSKVI